MEGVLANIQEALKSEGVEVDREEDVLKGELSFYIAGWDANKWEHFTSKVNKDKKICLLQKESEYTVRIVFETPFEFAEILKEDLEHFYACLQNRYHWVAPYWNKFSVLIKPTHLCNMNCRYCYDEPYRKEITEVMPLDTFRQTLQVLANSAETVHIIWHGGEPTLAGKDWFREADRIIKEEFPMLSVEQSMQTNGLNIDSEWIEIFSEMGIKPGISYDSIAQHVTRGRGAPGPDKYSCNEQKSLLEEERDLDKVSVENSLWQLKENGFGAGAINLITSANYHYKQMIDSYEYYMQRGFGGPCFNRVFDSENVREYNLGMDPEKYAEEFAKFFQYWLYDIRGGYERSAFEALGFVVGARDLTCSWNDCRWKWLGINPRGEVYPCDRYFPAKYKMGHIGDFDHVQEAFNTDAYETYTREIQQRFDTYCAECGFWFACRGGCNGTAIEACGDASGVDEKHCRVVRLKYQKVYEVLRSLDLPQDVEALNPQAVKYMIEHKFYPVGEIKRYMKEEGIFIPLRYNPRDLLNCSEHRLFRKINFIEGEKEGINIHGDFTYTSRGKDKVKKLNEAKRKFDFLNYLKEVVAHGASGGAYRRPNCGSAKCS